MQSSAPTEGKENCTVVPGISTSVWEGGALSAQVISSRVYTIVATG